jgi:hypothetical protein
MAFTFPRRDLSTVFFPTVHVHDGEVHDQAHFDHTLYVQHDGDLSATYWNRGVTPRHVHLDIGRSKGLIDADVTMQSIGLRGTRTNQDTWVRIGAPPVDVAA